MSVVKIPPQFQKDVSAGMITNVNENVVPSNSVALAMNLDFDFELGSAVSRLGTSIVNAQLVDNNVILGLHDFQYGTASGKLLAVINNAGDTQSVVYDVEAGTTITGWTTLTADTKARFVTFLDSVLLLNGSNAESSYNGTTVITTGGAFDLANIPSSNTVNLGLEWRNRVYVAGDNAEPDRLYYSSTPSAGAISWTSGNGNIDVEPEDGGGTITALGKVPGYVLIFKERTLHRWNFDSAFPESMINLGTPSQESVVNSAGVCAFFAASSRVSRGFYITDGGRPIPISHNRARNIKKWIDAIPRATEPEIAGIGTETYFMWSIGDVTVDGIDYTNVCVRWNRLFDQWSVRSYPTEFRFFSKFLNSSSENVVVGGDDDGNVIEIDDADVFTDYPSTAPIRWQLLYQDEDFGYNQIKEVSERIVINTRGIKGAKIEIILDGKPYALHEHAMGDVDKDIQDLPLKKVLRANRFQFGIRGNAPERITIKELEVPSIRVITDRYTL